MGRVPALGRPVKLGKQGSLILAVWLDLGLRLIMSVNLTPCREASRRPCRSRSALFMRAIFISSGRSAGWRKFPRHMAPLLLDAPYSATTRVFDLAESERADFVVLAGDILDANRAGPLRDRIPVEPVRAAVGTRCRSLLGRRGGRTSRSLAGRGQAALGRSFLPARAGLGRNSSCRRR